MTAPGVVDVAGLEFLVPLLCRSLLLKGVLDGAADGVFLLSFTPLLPDRGALSTLPLRETDGLVLPTSVVGLVVVPLFNLLGAASLTVVAAADLETTLEGAA